MKEIVKKILDKIIPINNKLMIFESKSDFSDNSRALFEYMIKVNLNNQYRMIWFVKDKSKFKNVKIKNVEFRNDDIKKGSILTKLVTTYYMYAAKYKFYTHARLLMPRKNQIVINLWHGTPLKSIKNYISDGKSFNYILCPSEFYKKIYIEEFNCKEEQLLLLGYPRNDLLFEKQDVIKKIFLNSNSGKIIVWMPTFRQHKNNDKVDGIDTFKYGIPIIDKDEDFENLNLYLKDNNIRLIIKLHPYQNLSQIEFKKLSNIVVINNDDLDKKDIKLYSLLAEADALITDYSSVFFDYLLLDRPIAFNVSDISEYGENRGYVFEDCTKFMPGMHINTIDDLLKFIKDLSLNKDEYSSEREKIRNLSNKYCDNKSSKRIIDFLKIIQ